MMEKFESQPEEEYHGYIGAPDSTPRARKSTRRDRLFRHALAATIIGLCFTLYLFVSKASISLHGASFFSCHRQSKGVHDGSSITSEKVDELPHGVSASKNASGNRVPFEAHVMSKCPDARDCLQKLVVPAMEQISDKVDFKLSFIADVSNKSTDVECMHGPGECIGDMLILCASNLPFNNTNTNTTGRVPVIRSLGYANCLIGEYPDIPDRRLVESCALEHGILFDDINHCASQENDDTSGGDNGQTPLSGIALLRESARYNKDLGVSTSCTVRLDDSVWCVRDGGDWKNCVQDGKGSDVSVLVDEINKRWKERN